MQRGHRHSLHRRYFCLFFGRAGLYHDHRVLVAVPGPGPSGAAQEARYPAGMLGPGVIQHPT